MRILQLIYTLAPGGAERMVVDLSNELSRQGHDVTLCVLRDDRQGNFGFYKHEVSEGINYVNLSIPIGLRLKNIYILYKLIKKLKPEIVHCHLNLVNYLFPLTIIFKKIKFFNTIHSIPTYEVSNSIEYWIRRYFFSNFKMKAITISEETSRFFLTYYKTPPFHEIYNGRAIPKPTPDYLDVKTAIQKYRKDGNTVFLHIGTCNAAKNQKMLISVFNRLVENGDHVILMIIGSGFDSEDGRNLKNLACDNIIFLGQKQNVSDYLLNADAFCLSSVIEGMPISLIEALACGCIPICTPVGGLINTINDGSTGYISKSVSENDYYFSVKSYLEDKNRVKKDDLIKYYNSHFSIEECAHNYLSLFEELN
jgi:glycosyltransferase involved in cell wall biosynthesis